MECESSCSCGVLTTSRFHTGKRHAPRDGFVTKIKTKTKTKTETETKITELCRQTSKAAGSSHSVTLSSDLQPKVS